jgi:hypothetical protein
MLLDIIKADRGTIFWNIASIRGMDPSKAKKSAMEWIERLDLAGRAIGHTTLSEMWLVMGGKTKAKPFLCSSTK